MARHINIGAIGWRNHASSVIKAVNLSSDASVKFIYHPQYVPSSAYDSAKGTMEFDDLLGMDGVMILSPNDTHMHYLELLRAKGFQGHIFCEKPPVTNVEELKRLRGMDASRVMYDFSLRHSLLSLRLRDQLKRIGRVIAANAWVSHGLAFKPEYPTSWRADRSRHEHGVLETASIHWIDLLLMLLGPAAGANHRQRNVAETGGSDDTSVLNLRHSCGAQSTVVTSYAAPALTRLSILGSDGVLDYDDDVLMLRGPRDTFDRSGRFKTPPARETEVIPDPFLDGMQIAIDEFLHAIEENVGFPSTWTQQSLETMDVIFECKGLIL